MLNPDQVRIVEVRQPDGAWARVGVGQLEPGDVVQMFEPDGSPVYDGKPMVITGHPNVSIAPLDQQPDAPGSGEK